MQDTPKIIGQGTYGCVYNPSMRCNKAENFNYTGKVSKLMLTKEAQTELNEFLIVAKIDPTNKYHLGTPKMCAPNTTLGDFTALKKHCKPAADINKSKLSLLIIDNGGPNLYNACVNGVFNKYFSTNTQERIRAFLTEFRSLLKGLLVFKNNDIVHYDIKPQNILFNPDTGQLKLIDFGLMSRRSEIVKSSQQSKNSLGAFHWSYPLECGFMNKKAYTLYDKFTNHNKKLFETEFIKKVTSHSNTKFVFEKDGGILKVSNPNAFNITFTYLDEKLKAPSNAIISGSFNTFFTTFNKLQQSQHYNTFLSNAIDSIDIYGFGMSMQYVINCLLIDSIISSSLHEELTKVLKQMWTVNAEDRTLDIEVLLHELNQLIIKTENNHEIVNNHTSVNNHKTANITTNKTSLKRQSSYSRLSTKLSTFAEKDAIKQPKKKHNATRVKSKNIRNKTHKRSRSK